MGIIRKKETGDWEKERRGKADGSEEIEVWAGRSGRDEGKVRDGSQRPCIAL